MTDHIAWEDPFCGEGNNCFAWHRPPRQRLHRHSRRWKHLPHRHPRSAPHHDPRHQGGQGRPPALSRRTATPSAGPSQHPRQLCEPPPQQLPRLRGSPRTRRPCRPGGPRRPSGPCRWGSPCSGRCGSRPGEVDRDVVHLEGHTRRVDHDRVVLVDRKELRAGRRGLGGSGAYCGAYRGGRPKPGGVEAGGWSVAPATYPAYGDPLRGGPSVGPFWTFSSSAETFRGAGASMR